MMAALTKYEQEMKDYLNKVTLMAPCYTFSPAIALPVEMVTEMNNAGVYAVNGPNADVEALCATISDPYC